MNEFENSTTLAKLLRSGSVAVLPTDTIYGVVTSALDERAVEGLYALKRRNPTKPYIILIGDLTELEHFEITLSSELAAKLNQYWPGPVSVILPCALPKFTYLHRGTNSLAFRLPAQARLRNLLKESGPLVAPSANPEGEPPAQSIDEAEAYFGTQVTTYLSGETSARPSKIIRISGDQIEIIRD